MDEQLRAEREGWRTSRCRYCGQKVIWIDRVDKKGKICLDPKAPVFRAWPQVAQGYQTKREPEPTRNNYTRDHFVSHFATCPAQTRAWKLLKEIVRAYECQDLDAEELFEEAQNYLSGRTR